MNDERERLEAAVAAGKEAEARLKAMDAEPDYEARKLIVTRILGAYHTTRVAGDPVPWILGRHEVQEAFAAIPLAPADPVDDAWVEALVKGEPPYTEARIRHAVSATLQRGARWPREAETIVPEVGSWVTWHGGECPVPTGTTVRFLFRDGSESTVRILNAEYWANLVKHCNIIAYRILGAAS